MLAEILQRRTGLSSSTDYTGYRRYASRRLKKLRHREGLTVRATKKYEPKPLAAGSDQWTLAVLMAERCWASAMGARAALEADTADTTASSLRHIIGSKLAKAVKYAELAASVDSEKLDSHVYVALLSGEAALEKQNWHKVAVHFAKVRLGASALMSGSTSTDLYADLLSTVVDPALRLALAQEKQDYTGDLNSIAVPLVHSQAPTFLQLVKAVNPNILSPDTAVKEMGEIRFRHHTAKVRYDSLAKILLAVHEKEEQLGEQSGVPLTAETNTDPASYDEVLSLWDQLTIYTHDISSEIHSAGQPREQDLDIISTYAQFHLLGRRIQRDTMIASREIGKNNAVRLYDVLLQSCESMAELPGVNNDDELLNGINDMKMYFQVKRTLALASLRPKGSLESLALVNFATKTLQNHVTDITDNGSHANGSALGLPIGREHLNQLVGQTKSILLRAHALAVICQEIENVSTVLGPVANNISFVQAAKEGEKVIIADYGARKLDPVAVKPVFYDIAYNYVRSEEPEEVVPEKRPESGKKGLFGLFK